MSSSTPPPLTFEEMPETWVKKPDALGEATLGVTIFLCITSIIVVALRMYVRLSRGNMAWDDWSMLVACMFFTVCSVFGCMGVYAGIGSLDTTLPSTWNMIAGGKWLTFWQITYAWSLPFIKFSIGLTILRITTQRVFRFMIWTIVALSMLSCLIGFFAVIFVCTPMEKSWKGALVEGTCADGKIITNISYLISALAVVTDWGCAIIPAIVVWGLQMKTKLKFSISVVLALGAVASAATIVRLPYLALYTSPVNYLHGLANIVLWSNIECGIGIIAGSLPSLRALVTFWLGKSTDRDNNYGSGQGTGGATNKGPSASIRMTAKSKANTQNLTVCEADSKGEWIQLNDSESQKHIITATRDVTVQYEPNEAGSRSHSDSSDNVGRY